MVALPTDLAVTKPLLGFTVATLVLLDAQVTLLQVTLAGYTVAVTKAYPFKFSCMFAGLTVTEATLMLAILFAPSIKKFFIKHSGVFHEIDIKKRRKNCTVVDRMKVAAILPDYIGISRR